MLLIPIFFRSNDAKVHKVRLCLLLDPTDAAASVPLVAPDHERAARQQRERGVRVLVLPDREVLPVEGARVMQCRIDQLVG